jgi:hypothetical protein
MVCVPTLCDVPTLQTSSSADSASCTGRCGSYATSGPHSANSQIWLLCRNRKTWQCGTNIISRKIWFFITRLITHHVIFFSQNQCNASYANISGVGTASRDSRVLHQWGVGAPSVGVGTVNMVHVRFEVFTAVTMKNGVFWDVTPCGFCKNRRFGGT